MSRKTWVMAICAVLAVVGVGVVALPDETVKAASSNGWTTTVQTSRAQVPQGSSVRVTVTVTSTAPAIGLVDLEVYSGGTKVMQRFNDNQAFRARVPRRFAVTWVVPANQAAGELVVKVGIFGRGWNGLVHWNDNAARFTVTAVGGPATTAATTTTQPATTTTRATTTTAATTTTQPTTTTTRATTTTAATSTTQPTTTTTQPPATTSLPPTTSPPTGRFATLPPGSALPSDASCASRVRPMAERRAINNVPNHTRGAAVSGLSRVTGDFVGTTDEIIQWVACKWGIDEDIVRAQIAQESWWHQDARGDMTNDQNACHPAVRTSSGPCPESVGLGQVRFLYHSPAFTNEYAIRSSAFNLDYTYSVWRGCYEGQYTWLNTVERGSTYAAGDQWGCVGVWFSGRWHTQPAETYIAAVKNNLSTRVWESFNFQGG